MSKFDGIRSAIEDAIAGSQKAMRGPRDGIGAIPNPRNATVPLNPAAPYRGGIPTGGTPSAPAAGMLGAGVLGAGAAAGGLAMAPRRKGKPYRKPTGY